MNSQEVIDWSACTLVESKQIIQNGTPVLRGTRLPALAIIANSDYGVSAEGIAEQFGVPVHSVQDIVAYA